jgi:hypothetical protein
MPHFNGKKRGKNERNLILNLTSFDFIAQHKMIKTTQLEISTPVHRSRHSSFWPVHDRFQISQKRAEVGKIIEF